MSRPSLLRRLTAGTLLWLVLALGAGGLALSFAFRESVEAGMRARLDSLLLALIAAVDVGADGTPVLARPIDEARFERVYSGWYWQIERDGQPLLRSRSLWDEALPTAGAALGPRGAPLLEVARDVQWPGQAAPLRLRVAVARTEMAVETARFNRLLLLSLGLLGAGLAAAVLVQVRFGLRPLRRLARDVARVREATLARLPDDYPAEIAPLAGAVNDLLAHDAALIERARTHVGNLAHALKTPLAVLRAELPADHPGAAPLADMTRLVQHHLARAAAAGAVRTPGARTALLPVLEALRGSLRRLHAARAPQIDLEAAPALQFHGERQDLEEMLGNLLDNACTWTAQRVQAAARLDGDRLIIDIDDDGPGLDPARAAVARQRGARLDADTPGNGLGLAIAGDLAALYGGSLELGTAPLGGLRARLRLPGGERHLPPS